MSRRSFARHFGLVLLPLAYGGAFLAGVLRYLRPVPMGRGKSALEAGHASDYRPGEPPRRFEVRFTRLGDKLVWVLHDGETLRAFDASCTHLGCNVRWPKPGEPDYERYAGSFRCYCHGARFDREGRATLPPAKEPLRELALRDLAETAGKIVVLDRYKEVT